MSELIFCFKLIWQFFISNWQGIVAITALALSLWQLLSQRKHDRLSVRPYLSAGYKWHCSSDKGLKSFEVVVVNNGIGPAIIKDCFVEIDGKRIPGIGEINFQNTIRLMFPDYEFKYNYLYLNYGYAMAVNERMKILNVSFLGPKYPSLEYLKQLLTKHVDLKICYDSFYKKQPIFSSLEYMKKTSKNVNNAALGAEVHK